jgi:hypothetical protein
MAQAKAIFAAQDRIDMTIRYCSVHDDCCIARRQDPNVQPAARCEHSGGPFEKNSEPLQRVSRGNVTMNPLPATSTGP